MLGGRLEKLMNNKCGKYKQLIKTVDKELRKSLDPHGSGIAFPPFSPKFLQ